MRYLGVVLFLAALSLASDKIQSDTATEVKNAVAGVELLRDSLNDPDSLVVERIYARMEHKPDTPTICIAYRARNKFNAYIRDIAEYGGKSKILPQTLGKGGWCGGIDRNLDRALSHGWADITDEYKKEASVQH